MSMVADQDATDHGIRCPRCNCAHVPVQRTVRIRGKLVRRYRVCRFCRRHFSTTEKASGTA